MTNDIDRATVRRYRSVVHIDDKIVHGRHQSSASLPTAPGSYRRVGQKGLRPTNLRAPSQMLPRGDHKRRHGQELKPMYTTAGTIMNKLTESS